MSTAIDKASGFGNRGSDLSQWTDEELIIGYRETGDTDLYEELVHRYDQEIYSYLRGYLGSPEMAEDAYQGTFLQLHLKCGQFMPGRKVRPWLYMIATHQAIDLQRRGKRHRSISLDHVGPHNNEDSGKLADLLLSREPNPVDRVDEEESRRWIREALDQLPEYLKLAVTLVYFQGLKYREAAEVLSVPVGTVKSRLHAAILRLSDAWKRAQPHTK
jgi:RNA polymerase sigma-70 factor (ECF subfamily)